MTSWPAYKKLRELRTLTEALFADVDDIERLYIKINATVKGHVDWVQFDEMMADQPDDFYGKMTDLNEALLQTAQHLSPFAWALNDECKALFDFPASELASRLLRLSELSSNAIADYKMQSTKRHRPKHVAVDRLVMELAHIYFEGCRCSPTFRRENGQLALSQTFIALLQAIYSVLPNALNFRSSSEDAFIGRAKRSASKIEQYAGTHSPYFYRDSAA